MSTPRHRIVFAGTVIALVGIAPAAFGQSVDISQAYLRAGHALDLSVRVRTEGAGAAPLPRHCIQAEWIADGRLWTADDTRVTTGADVDPEWTRVRLQHRHRPQDTQAEVRLVLRCGPTYERHFTVSSRPGTPPGTPLPRTPGKTRSTATASASGTQSGGARAVAARPANLTLPSVAQRPSAPAIDGTPPGTTNLADRPDPDASTNAAHARDEHAMATAPSNASAGLATAQVHRPTAPLATDTATPAQAHEVARLLHALDRLQSEHQKALARMGVLRARLVHLERSPSTTTWAVLGGLLLLTLVQFIRLRAGEGPKWMLQDAPSRHRHDKPQRMRWPWSRVSDHQPQEAPSPDLRPALTAHAGSSTHAVASNVSLDRTPLKLEQENPWRHAEFGSASLEPAGIEETLTEVERLAADGYPAAATITIEQALMHQAGKHPALLLALLDLYEEMGQPWNRERVIAQLETLYNVNAKGSDAVNRPAEDAGLEACRESLDRIQRTWRGTEAASAIASLLRRPAAVEVLPLAAFREAVWLYRLCSSPSSAAETGITELSLEPLPRV
jgi:hypothetical protein